MFFIIPLWNSKIVFLSMLPPLFSVQCYLFVNELGLGPNFGVFEEYSSKLGFLARLFLVAAWVVVLFSHIL